jgi:hypothetical protein
MNTFYILKLEIKLKAPFLIHGADPGRFGLDSVELTDHNGNLILPASLLIGRIRDTMRLVAEQDLTAPLSENWFGTEGHRGKGQRARIWTADLTCPRANKGINHDIPRIKISDETGAVETGALQIIEQSYAVNDTLTFTGQWCVFASPTEINEVLLMIRAGIAAQAQLGGERSIGFGRLKTVNVTMASQKANEKPPIKTTHLRLTLTTEQAFCVDASTPKGNVFVSQDFLSGGTIKGALATMLCAQQGVTQLIDIPTHAMTKANGFDNLRITHVQPSAGGNRSQPLAQSLVRLGTNDPILEAAHCQEPVLHKSRALQFQIDWKNKPEQRGQTHTHLRVRTRIDADTRTAKDGDLFAYECRYAEPTQTQWLCDVQGDVLALEALQNLINDCGGKIGPIGKTDTFFNAHFEEIKAPAVMADPQHPNQWRVTLASDALLFETPDLKAKADDLQCLYQQAFRGIQCQGGKEPALELSHFFARQKLVGGAVMQNKQSGGTYQPWVLTEAGSVFVFTLAHGASQADAMAIFENWQSNGLPNIAYFKGDGQDWKSNPYLRQNGWGEVIVNQQHGYPPLLTEETPA